MFRVEDEVIATEVVGISQAALKEERNHVLMQRLQEEKQEEQDEIVSRHVLDTLVIDNITDVAKECIKAGSNIFHFYFNLNAYLFIFH